MRIKLKSEVPGCKSFSCYDELSSLYWYPNSPQSVWMKPRRRRMNALPPWAPNPFASPLTNHSAIPSFLASPSALIVDRWRRDGRFSDGAIKFHDKFYLFQTTTFKILDGSKLILPAFTVFMMQRLESNKSTIVWQIAALTVDLLLLCTRILND